MTIKMEIGLCEHQKAGSREKRRRRGRGGKGQCGAGGRWKENEDSRGKKSDGKDLFTRIRKETFSHEVGDHKKGD